MSSVYAYGLDYAFINFNYLPLRFRVFIRQMSAEILLKIAFDNYKIV